MSVVTFGGRSVLAGIVGRSGLIAGIVLYLPQSCVFVCRWVVGLTWTCFMSLPRMMGACVSLLMVTNPPMTVQSCGSGHCSLLLWAAGSTATTFLSVKGTFSLMFWPGSKVFVLFAKMAGGLNRHQHCSTGGRYCVLAMHLDGVAVEVLRDVVFLQEHRAADELSVEVFNHHRMKVHRPLIPAKGLHYFPNSWHLCYSIC